MKPWIMPKLSASTRHWRSTLLIGVLTAMMLGWVQHKQTETTALRATLQNMQHELDKEKVESTEKHTKIVQKVEQIEAQLATTASPTRTVVGSVCNFGNVPWNNQAFLLAEVEAFSEVYHDQAKFFGKTNDGGNGVQHSFALWVVIRHLRPNLIVESGILNGQTSWLIHRATRGWDPLLVRIDPKSYDGVWTNMDPRNRSVDLIGNSFIDFASAEWDKIAPGLPLASGLAFFDDHMDHLIRLKEARAAGFGHVIFDDNFVPGHGDLFSIKNACDGGAGDTGVGASGGVVRRAFTKKSKQPQRCTKFHKHCSQLTNNGAVAARRELIEMSEAIWEAPPLTSVRTIDQYLQLARITKWAEGRTPQSELDLRMLSKVTKDPLFASIEEAANKFKMTIEELNNSRGWYMHMVYVQIK